MGRHLRPGSPLPCLSWSPLCSLTVDCGPVTLFEVEDLWQEAQRLQHCGLPGPVPTSSWAGGLNSDLVDQTALPKPKTTRRDPGY